MKTKDDLITKLKEYIEYLIHSPRLTFKMNEFESEIAALDKEINVEKKRLKEPHKWQCIFYQQHGISCSNPIRKNGDCIGINCGYFKTQESKSEVGQIKEKYGITDSDIDAAVKIYVKGKEELGSKPIEKQEYNLPPFNFCPGCGKDWELDSDEFGCWSCGYSKVKITMIPEK